MWNWMSCSTPWTGLQPTSPNSITSGPALSRSCRLGGSARGSNPQYDVLRRAWTDLLPGLPLIDGWTITAPLPDIDEIGRASAA